MPRNVLIVGNESKSLQIFSQHLSPYSADYTILTAANGNEALKILRASMIDLLVTDLQIPQQEGFQLLLNISTKHPLVPVLVVNISEDSCGKDIASPTLGNSLDPAELRDSILEIATDPKKAGAIFGVCLSNFLQLIEKENGSCTLVVVTPSKAEGFFLFKDGVLAQAFLSNIRGKEAAQAMLAHKKVTIMIRRLPERNIPNEIECSVRSILIEAAQHESDRVNAEKNASQEPIEVKKNKVTAKQNQIILNNVLQELITVKGVTAVGFMGFNGEMLAVKSHEKMTEADMIITTFNDIFRQAHKACRKIDMKTIDEVVINTPKGTIIMLCLEVDNAEHMHLIALLDPHGNKAFFKLKAAKLLSLLNSYR